MTRSGNSAQQKAPTLVFKRLRGREGPLMAEIYIFCFPIYFPNMSGISGLLRYSVLQDSGARFTTKTVRVPRIFLGIVSKGIYEGYALLNLQELKLKRIPDHPHHQLHSFAPSCIA